MSKILQNIANHVEFSKEQHMVCFNDFVRSNFEAGRRFFIQVKFESIFNVFLKFMLTEISEWIMSQGLKNVSGFVGYLLTRKQQFLEKILFWANKEQTQHNF